ncbi:secreted protein C-like isoform X2 [Haliotis rubra]|uniref:secreted protein C-like isoform X2 n=1 Tax=Haliotis rubra TaxID=36100 RepID=UPI001EE5272E|nr:secreted protein C-like isoform X2 [Haliotis rubra]
MQVLLVTKSRSPKPQEPERREIQGLPDDHLVKRQENIKMPVQRHTDTEPLQTAFGFAKGFLNQPGASSESNSQAASSSKSTATTTSGQGQTPTTQSQASGATQNSSAGQGQSSSQGQSSAGQGQQAGSAPTSGAQPGRGTTSGAQPGGGTTSGAQPGRGTTSGAQPGRGTTSGAQPGRGTTSGAQPGRGTTSGARPGRSTTSETQYQFQFRSDPNSIHVELNPDGSMSGNFNPLTLPPGVQFGQNNVMVLNYDDDDNLISGSGSSSSSMGGAGGTRKTSADSRSKFKKMSKKHRTVVNRGEEIDFNHVDLVAGDIGPKWMDLAVEVKMNDEQLRDLKLEYNMNSAKDDYEYCMRVINDLLQRNPRFSLRDLTLSLKEIGCQKTAIKLIEFIP